MANEPGGITQRRGSRNVHATAVAIGHRGLLLIGPSRSGKSRLALALIAATRPGRPIVLVGDDRIFLSTARHEVIARPHPRIAGFIERRGLGIVALPYRAAVALAAIVDLGAPAARGADLPDLPTLVLAGIGDVAAARDAVLQWWHRSRLAAANATTDVFGER